MGQPIGYPMAPLSSLSLSLLFDNPTVNHTGLLPVESSGASDAVRTLGYAHPELTSSANGDFRLKNNKEMVSKTNPPDAMKGLGEKGSSHPMPPSEFPDPSPNRSLLDILHRNYNEGITLEEFTAAWSEAIRNRFDNLDANCGGATSKEELGKSRKSAGDLRDPRGLRQHKSGTHYE